MNTNEIAYLINYNYYDLTDIHTPTVLRIGKAGLRNIRSSIRTRKAVLDSVASHISYILDEEPIDSRLIVVSIMIDVVKLTSLPRADSITLAHDLRAAIEATYEENT